MGTTFLTVTPAVPPVSPTAGSAPAIPHTYLFYWHWYLLNAVVQRLLRRQVSEHFKDFTAQGKEGSSG